MTFCVLWFGDHIVVQDGSDYDTVLIGSPLTVKMFKRAVSRLSTDERPTTVLEFLRIAHTYRFSSFVAPHGEI